MQWKLVNNLQMAVYNTVTNLGQSSVKYCDKYVYSQLPIYRAFWGKQIMHGISECTVNRESEKSGSKFQFS